MQPVIYIPLSYSDKSNKLHVSGSLQDWDFDEVIDYMVSRRTTVTDIIHALVSNYKQLQASLLPLSDLPFYCTCNSDFTYLYDLVATIHYSSWSLQAKQVE